MKTVSTLCATLLLAPALALADARIEFRSTEGSGSSLQSLLIGHGKARSDADANTSVIFDPAAGEMIMLDHRKREFTRLGAAQLAEIGGAMESAMAELERAMADMPPEVRAQMRGAMGGAMPGMGSQPLIQVVETSQRDSVGGIPCTVYRTEFQGQLKGESCLGDASALTGLSSADRATLDAVMEQTKAMMEQVAKGPMAPMADTVPFRQGLVPLRVTEIEGSRRNTSEFAGIDASPLDAALFQVPSGYREQRIEMPGASGRRRR